MSNFWKTLPKPFFALAPMEGATDMVFRQIVQKAAPADVYFTEFTNTDSFCSPKGQASTAARLRIAKGEGPVIAQIWGTNPEHFAQMAKGIATMGFAGIDINMGCPVKDVTKKGACSALIETPALAADIIAATKEGGLPVSVKTRIGFKTQKTEEWAGFLLGQDITALTIHARTAKEMSKVPAHWEEVAKVVQLRNEVAPQTVILGNGDVANRADGLAKAQATGADGVMIGRGIFANPFCFENKPTTHQPAELVSLLNLHLDLFDDAWPHHQFAPLKRFFKVYIKGFEGASEIREQLMQTRTTAEARAVIAAIPTGVLQGVL
ncbi:MAG TPA: tRNA-dihydrouridine synthase [Candidatus Acidoferrum sp.]|nr:tRNA-dihydrouridine synthase [Candidatus Acidoferrum sp.]